MCHFSTSRKNEMIHFRKVSVKFVVTFSRVEMGHLSLIRGRGKSGASIFVIHTWSLGT